MTKKLYLNSWLAMSLLLTIPLHAMNEPNKSDAISGQDRNNQELIRWQHSQGIRRGWTSVERLAWLSATHTEANSDPAELNREYQLGVWSLRGQIACFTFAFLYFAYRGLNGFFFQP